MKPDRKLTVETLISNGESVSTVYASHSLAETAKAFGVSRYAMHEALQQMGILRESSQALGGRLRSSIAEYSAEELKAKLQELYIEQNKSQRETAELLGLTPKILRKLLAQHGLKKTSEDYHQASKTTFIERYGEEAWRERFAKAKRDPAKVEDGHRRAGIAKRATHKARHTEEGITEELLRDLYLTQNLSLRAVGDHLGKTKSGVRSLLSSYGISKPPALVKAAKERGSAELYSDPERVAAMVQKTKTTCRERYGEHWYYNNASQWEHRLKELLEEALPGIIIEQSVYNLIRQPGSGGALQLDLYFPQARVAVEANGEYWHDRGLWEQDQEEGTELSREQLKTRLCEEKAILLLHLWDSTWKTQPEEELARIVAAVEARLLPKLQEVAQ